MSTSVSAKNCNFSCTCNRADCDRKHYIETIDDRAKVKELFEKHFDKSIHKETDPEGTRNAPCFFGALCGKTGCGFKHYCSIEFRTEVMSKEWRKISFRNNKDKILTEMKEKYGISDEDMEKLKKI